MDHLDLPSGGRSNWEQEQRTDPTVLPSKKGTLSNIAQQDLYSTHLPSIAHHPTRLPPPPSVRLNDYRTQHEQSSTGLKQHGQQLYNMGLSPAQLHARQQLITAYMMQNGGVASANQPFVFPGGGFPGLPPQSPQAPQEASPAPKYREVENIVAKLRENMLKVLKSPNYKRCKSAKNIRQALREVRSLCKDMRNETTEMGKQKTNGRKKGATPEGEKRQAKKQKGEGTAGEEHRRVEGEAGDAKDPEEVSQQGGGHRMEGDGLERRLSQGAPGGGSRGDENEHKEADGLSGKRNEDKGEQVERGVQEAGTNASPHLEEGAAHLMQEQTR